LVSQELNAFSAKTTGMHVAQMPQILRNLAFAAFKLQNFPADVKFPVPAAAISLFYSNPFFESHDRR
jgi:hypothetical protein